MKNIRKILCSAATAVFTGVAALAISVSAATRAVESDAVTVVTAGTTDTTEYAITIAPTDNSKISWWFDDGYSEDDFTWTATATDPDYTRYLVGRTSNDKMSGHVGAWIEDVAYYNGKSISVKETYYWNELELDCTKNLKDSGDSSTYSDSTGKVHVDVTLGPAVCANASAIATAGGGVIGHFMSYHSYTVSTTFYYTDDLSTPVTIDGNIRLTMGDIDYLQYYAIKANTGSITKVEALSDCNVCYAEQDGYKIAYSVEAKDHSNIEQDELSFILTNSNGYTMICGSGADPFSYYNEGNGITVTYDQLGTKISSDGDYYYTYQTSWRVSGGTYKTVTDPQTFYGNKYCYKISHDMSEADVTTWGTTEWAYINSFSYGPGTPNIQKFVTDTNETHVTENGTGSGETYTYLIEVSVPVERASYQYSSFEITDTLPIAVDYRSVTGITNAQTGKDVSSWFTVSSDNGIPETLTITASSTALETAGFYGQTYIFAVSVRQDDSEATSLTRHAYTGSLKYVTAYYTWSNKATLNWTNKSSTTARSEESNEVNTYFYVRDLVVTKNWSDSNFVGRPDSVKVTLVNEGTATLDDSNNWTYTFADLPAYDADQAKATASGSMLSYSPSEIVPTGYTSSKATTTTDKVSTVTFTNTLNVGEVTIQKSVSPTTAAALSGFKFTLSGVSLNGTSISLTATTDADGKATISNIPYGTYTLKEVNVPSNATVSPTEQAVTIDADNETLSYSFVNTYSEDKGQITVQKVVTPSAAAALSGFTFSLTGTSEWGTTVSMTANTDASGKASFENVPYGTYTLKETNVPSSATVSPAERTVTVSKDKVSETYTFTNTYDEPKGSVTVKKSVVPATAAPLSGFTFKLSGTSNYGTEVDMTATTDDDGNCSFADVPYGTYTLTETNIPDNATASPAEQSVTVDATTTAKVYTVTNTFTERTGNVKVTKTADDNAVAGITFSLTGTSSYGNPVSMTATTDASGVATFTGVPLSDDTGYTVTEVDVALKYITPTASTGIKVTAANTTEVKVENKLTTTTISKVDESGNPVVGASLAVYDSTGKEIDSWTSEKTAHTISGLEKGATYTLKETKPAPGYTTAADVTFTVSASGAETRVTMVDKPTVISIIKYDNEAKPLSGAVLQILDADGSAIDEWTTDGNAHTVTGTLVVGQTYTLHEKSAPKFYAVAEDVAFTVKDTDTVQNVSMTDELKLADFVFTKTDSSGTPLSGAAYTLYVCNNTSDNHTHETDMQNLSGNCWTELATGKSGTDGKVSFTGLQAELTYALVETQAPDGYQLADGYFILKADDTADGGWTVTSTCATLNLSYSKNNGWTLKNRVKFVLPKAGGNGVSPFVMVGMMITFVISAMAVISKFSPKIKQKRS